MAIFPLLLSRSTPVEGFVDDYADVIKGLLDLYEATFDPEWLLWAERLQEAQDTLFWDPKDGGYFSSTGKDPSIVLNLKDGNYTHSERLSTDMQVFPKHITF